MHMVNIGELEWHVSDPPTRSSRTTYHLHPLKIRQPLSSRTQKFRRSSQESARSSSATKFTKRSHLLPLSLPVREVLLPHHRQA
jgi:hypothetical protein